MFGEHGNSPYFVQWKSSQDMVRVLCKNRSFTMADLFQNLICTFDPDQGTRVLVVAADVGTGCSG